MSPIRTGISSPLFPVGNLLCLGIFKLSAITVSVEKVGDVARNVILQKNHHNYITMSISKYVSVFVHVQYLVHSNTAIIIQLTVSVT